MDAAGLMQDSIHDLPLHYGYTENLNETKKPGCYVIDVNTTGALPLNSPTTYNVAMCIVFGYHSFPCQLYLVAPPLSPDKYIRWFLGGTWSSWIKF